MQQVEQVQRSPGCWPGSAVNKRPPSGFVELIQGVDMSPFGGDGWDDEVWIDNDWGAEMLVGKGCRCWWLLALTVGFLRVIAGDVFHDADNCFVLWRLHCSPWPDFSPSDLSGPRNITIVIILISQVKVWLTCNVQSKSKIQFYGLMVFYCPFNFT